MDLPNNLTPCIDRSIVMTQYDLRGFAHSVLGRVSDNPKSFNATVMNFLSFIVYDQKAGAMRDPAFFGSGDHDHRPYEDFLVMCRRIHEFCDLSQVEAIQFIIRDFLSKHAEWMTKIESGECEKTGYITELTQETQLGKVILSLAGAFEVDIPKVTTA